MTNATIHRSEIKKIALALGELNDQVIYVGGAAVGLYVNDPAADDVRPTKDVDISLSVASIGELEQMREELIKKGFIQTAEDNVICRFQYDHVKVDVMNSTAIGWAPANPWFAPGFSLKESLDIEGLTIQILPLPYFIATKFEAYNSRGKNDPRTSQDFEDIVYILDNRTDLTKILINISPRDVKVFLNGEFSKILAQPELQEAISSNLFYETRDERFSMIMEKLKAINEEYLTKYSLNKPYILNESSQIKSYEIKFIPIFYPPPPRPPHPRPITRLRSRPPQWPRHRSRDQARCDQEYRHQ